MPAVDPFDAYISKLRKFAMSDKTEHSDRAALETLLQAMAAEKNAAVLVQHEPKRSAASGAPDYKAVLNGMILGYVENKPVGNNLDKTLKSEQIAKYRTLSGNIILTDYLHFIWISETGVQRESLCHASDLENRKFRLRPDRVEAVRNLLHGFFSTPPQGLGRASQLAIALATRARLLRDSLFEELTRQQKEHQEGRLLGLYQVFQKQVFQELTLKEFADAFAQMLAYGLFLARLNSDNEPVSLHNAREFVPSSFQLIRELVDFLAELDKKDYAQVRWVVEEILSIVNGLDLLAIHEDLSFRHRKATTRKLRAKDEEEHRLFERDPFIYFYEDFLNHYDKDTRKARGVYYTPPPVVSFIVRAVDDILKDTFAIKQGLADHQRVTVLDFACGTGTFLLEVFQRIFDNIGGANAGHADLIVREHLLKNIYGFEYLIAPYTIAHLKLSQYLRELQLPLKDDERLKVFLTNTLEPIKPQKDLLFPGVTAEGEAAHAIKKQPVLVIVGNPPYAGHSKNKGKWITSQIKKYREGFPDLSKPGQGKWLQDDYVKFIRFAQIKMDGGSFEFSDKKGDPQTIEVASVEQGVIAVITNHSFLDNPTFKGMRKSLLTSFNQIFIVDLHGNTKKSEAAPDGSRDENVFDIEQGVSITLLVKSRGLENKVLHCDLWGNRISKYRATALTAPSDMHWEQVRPSAPDYLFKPQNKILGDKYRMFASVADMFSKSGDPAPGFVTTHDEFAISYSGEESIEKVRTLLLSSSETEARNSFRLCSQSQWNYSRAKAELKNIKLKNHLQAVTYRPFDQRWTIWDRNVAVHKRDRVNHHLRFDNMGLVACRQVKSGATWQHVYITSEPAESTAVSNRTSEICYSFPLYIYACSDTGEISKKENISDEIRGYLDSLYEYHFSPEEIFGYAYACLYSDTYRTRYCEFLRRDFPRIPFPQDRQHFGSLSSLGWALVQAHLLRDLPRKGIAKYAGKGDHAVERVVWGEADQRIHINQTQSFGPVPEPVWRFTIGGYQVLDKYLKSRKGRKLSLDEVKHVGAVADCLAFTIKQMARIDEAWRQAFPDRG